MWERVFAAALIGAVTAVGVGGIRLLRRLLRGATDLRAGVDPRAGAGAVPDPERSAP